MHGDPSLCGRLRQSMIKRGDVRAAGRFGGPHHAAVRQPQAGRGAQFRELTRGILRKGQSPKLQSLKRSLHCAPPTLTGRTHQDLRPSDHARRELVARVRKQQLDCRIVADIIAIEVRNDH
jgi:hypothetical protein